MVSTAADASRPVIPGSLVQLYGLGVLVRGESGTGKSELVLGLLDRGHTLIADDAIALETSAAGLEGHCPEALAGLIAIRGLGVLDVRELFGAPSWRSKAPVDLVIELTDAPLEADALAVDAGTTTILATSLPCLRLPVGRGRDLPLLVEMAVRSHQGAQA